MEESTQHELLVSKNVLDTSGDTIGVRYLQKHFHAEDVLAEGYLTKIGSFWKSQKRRWFVISFQDIRYYENKDAFARGDQAYGSLLVSEIQSIQQSDALGFGPNTSLSIRTKTRVLELGDQKEHVADSLFYVLNRWVALRDAKNDRSLSPGLTVPVIEMPSILQREAARCFVDDPMGLKNAVMQEPPLYFSWTNESRHRIQSEYSHLFEHVFGAEPNTAIQIYDKYILLNGQLTNEIVIFVTEAGKIRRVVMDAAPLVHYLVDHHRTITRCNLMWFDEITDLTPFVSCLKDLKQHFGFQLVEFDLPTSFSSLTEISTFCIALKDIMPDIDIRFTDPDSDTLATQASAVNSRYSTYSLQLRTTPSKALLRALAASSSAPSLESTSAAHKPSSEGETLSRDGADAVSNSESQGSSSAVDQSLSVKSVDGSLEIAADAPLPAVVQDGELDSVSRDSDSRAPATQ